MKFKSFYKERGLLSSNFKIFLISKFQLDLQHICCFYSEPYSLKNSFQDVDHSLPPKLCISLQSGLDKRLFDHFYYKDLHIQVDYGDICYMNIEVCELSYRKEYGNFYNPFKSTDGISSWTPLNQFDHSSGIWSPVRPVIHL